MPLHFDAIVVGGGTSGSVVTRRLVDAGRRVLLLEAGGEDTNPAIHDPARAHELWHAAEDWDYYTVPQPHAANRRLHWPRGKVLGGSGALNAMIWVRGAAVDFDSWAAAGCAGWSWADVLPVYRALETFRDTADVDMSLHGTAGPMDVIRDYPLAPIQQAILHAAPIVGIPYNPDYNGASQDGISREQVNIQSGHRLSTYRAYLAPIRGHERLTVHTGARVHRIECDGDRATGVTYEVGGELREAVADEIVLAAGALDSPRLLLLSGIGPADQLTALGIDVTADLPGVGNNLHDHLISPVIFSTERVVEAPPPGASMTQTHSFWRSRPGLPAPDTQPLHFSAPMYDEGMSGPENGFTLMAGLVAPLSRGELHLTSADPHARLAMDPNILSEDDDVAALAASVRQCQELGAAVAGWGAVERYPGPDLTDTEVWDYVRRTAITYHHQVGTCRMGTDELAVVDPTLAVRGVTGLHVADASIMPTITRGNTNAPAAMIGEKAAAFLTAS